MIKSMTGFGRCELARNDRKFTVEIKSVNHRYMDVTIKMPKKLNFFEASIRNLLKEYMQRGKIDVFITYEDYSESTVAVKYSKEIAAEYMQYLVDHGIPEEHVYHMTHTIPAKLLGIEE